MTPAKTPSLERQGYHHGNLKEALVAAARKLIAERGPAGFTLAEAARLAGVSAAAPYRHFKDRSALIAEVAQRGFREFGARMGAAWSKTAADPVAAFERMGETYLAFARDEQRLRFRAVHHRPRLREGASISARDRDRRVRGHRDVRDAALRSR